MVSVGFLILRIFFPSGHRFSFILSLNFFMRILHFILVFSPSEPFIEVLLCVSYLLPPTIARKTADIYCYRLISVGQESGAASSGGFQLGVSQVAVGSWLGSSSVRCPAHSHGCWQASGDALPESLSWLLVVLGSSSQESLSCLSLLPAWQLASPTASDSRE